MIPRHLTLWITLVFVAPHCASACTAEEAKEKGAIAGDRAALFSMVDLEGGRALQRRMLGMQLAGMASGSEADRDNLCALYDDVTKTANEGLAASKRRR